MANDKLASAWTFSTGPYSLAPGRGRIILPRMLCRVSPARRHRVAGLLSGLALGGLLSLHAATIQVAVEAGSPRIEFGLTRLERALAEIGHSLARVGLTSESAAPISVIVGADQAARLTGPALLEPLAGPEDFRISRRSPAHRGALVISAQAGRGAMYGLLDLAGQLRLSGSLDLVPARVVKARLPFRAIKFNLPWDSYRRSEALQTHLETCRDPRFWEAFLDMMAENRFNALSLWNLHPFPYLIRPTNFPEACPFDDAGLADWQRFWRTLFRMAKDRGIDTYLVNWNIFVSPEFARAHGVATDSIDGKFFGDGDTSGLIERYTRECVTQVIDEYPDLTGLGITLGEGMGGMTPAERRDWLDRTFIAGIQAASRPVRFIHRAPLSANTGSGGSVSKSVEQLTREALERMEFDEPILVEFKYNWSHGHSSPKLHIVHGGPLTDTYWNPPPTNYQVVWTVRNEDFFVLRWGQPDFIREFIANNAHGYVGGCFIGSECYIPARDYLHGGGPHQTWDYAFQRQWLFYQMWGRLLYDPATPDAVFAGELARRHGAGLGDRLLEAWKRASRTPLTLATFFKGTWDGTLYSEGFLTARQGGAGQFIDIDTFIQRPPLDPQYVGITEFVKAGGKVADDRLAPPQVAASLASDADRVFALTAGIRAGGEVLPTLECELKDLESWAWMARYIDAKIRGGVALANFRRTGNAADRKAAVAALEEAVCHWRKLADAIASHNRPTVPYQFDEEFSWLRKLPDALKDVQTARAAVPAAVEAR